MSCCDWPTCASVLLPARRLFHRDWLARKRPLVSTGSRPKTVIPSDGRKQTSMCPTLARFGHKVRNSRFDAIAAFAAVNATRPSSPPSLDCCLFVAAQVCSARPCVLEGPRLPVPNHWLTNRSTRMIQIANFKLTRAIHPKNDCSHTVRQFNPSPSIDQWRVYCAAVG
jgi:hypothetical protein